MAVCMGEGYIKTWIVIDDRAHPTCVLALLVYHILNTILRSYLSISAPQT